MPKHQLAVVVNKNLLENIFFLFAQNKTEKKVAALYVSIVLGDLALLIQDIRYLFNNYAIKINLVLMLSALFIQIIVYACACKCVFIYV